MNKIQVTAQQRANAIEARDVMWPSVPPKNVFVRLGWWRNESRRRDPHCGTVACFGGWCALWPPYRRQGVLACAVGAPCTKLTNDTREVSKMLFGDAPMFSPRDCHQADISFKGTDHELVTHRLNWLIANSEIAA